MDAAAYARQLQQLLPRGAAWQVEPGSVLSALLLGVADEYARLQARVSDLASELDPRTTSELLLDWERVLGLPNPCVTGEQSIAQRRAAAVAKFTALGGQTPAYFIAVAAALGFAITITEYQPADVEDDVDAPIYGDAWAYWWEITAPLNTFGEMSVEDLVDESLGWWGNVALECVINQLKPAHTHVIFTYGEPIPSIETTWTQRVVGVSAWRRSSLRTVGRGAHLKGY